MESKTSQLVEAEDDDETALPASLQTANNSLKSVEGLDQSTARVCMPALEQCFQTSESIEKTISAEWTPCLPGELFM